MPDRTGRLHSLDYDSAVAMRYHGHRMATLGTLSRLDPALSMIFGGAAFATILQGYAKTAAVAAFIVTATSALNLAFGLGDRAREHEKLFRRWGDIRVRLARVPESDDQTLREIETMAAEINAESPWQLIALSVHCENEEKQFRNQGALFKIGPIQRLFLNWFTLPGSKPVQETPPSQ